jgi:hypothetical protein
LFSFLRGCKKVATHKRTKKGLACLFFFSLGYPKKSSALTEPAAWDFGVLTSKRACCMVHEQC